MTDRTSDRAISRRQLVKGAAALGILANSAGASRAPAQARAGTQIREFAAQASWVPEPPFPARIKTAMAPLSPARLWYWDSQGAGEPVVLLHAATGSARCWAYQLDALTRNGYRVIAYSRRGHSGSERGPEDDFGRMIDDLDAFVDYLKLDRFHLVGTALGGYGVADYAISHPQRVRSITLASTLAGIDEPEFAAAAERLTPAEFKALPVELKEVGPSYRAANPAGLARWIELDRTSRVGEPLRQAKANRISWDALRKLPMPALVMTGQADLYFPPALLMMIKQRLPHWHAAIIAEAGHAAYWEQPLAFNTALVDFLAAARRARG